MKFIELVNQIKSIEKCKVRIVKLGMFYEAFGIDAYILNLIAGLKVTKFGDGTPKCGFPVSSISKYINILNQENVWYAVYHTCEEGIDFTGINTIDYNGTKYYRKYFDEIRADREKTLLEVATNLDEEENKVDYMKNLLCLNDIVNERNTLLGEEYE